MRLRANRWHGIVFEVVHIEALTMLAATSARLPGKHRKPAYSQAGCGHRDKCATAESAHYASLRARRRKDRFVHGLTHTEFEDMNRIDALLD